MKELFYFFTPSAGGIKGTRMGVLFKTFRVTEIKKKWFDITAGNRLKEMDKNKYRNT